MKSRREHVRDLALDICRETWVKNGLDGVIVFTYDDRFGYAGLARSGGVEEGGTVDRLLADIAQYVQDRLSDLGEEHDEH